MAGCSARSLFKVLQDACPASTPQYWQFWIGLLLVVIVLVGRERLSAARPLVASAATGGAAMSAVARPAQRRRPCSQTTRPGQALRRHRRHRRRRAAFEKGARHALIGPNGAGKTTLDQSADRACSSRRRARSPSPARTSPGCRAPPRARRGIARTFQINQLFRGLTPLESMTLLAVAATGPGGRVAARRRARDARRRARPARCSSASASPT